MAESNKLQERVGQQVGDYRLLRLLGGGGFGQVYLAEHIRNRSLAAVKILQARLTNGEELKAFINEARTFRLKHPHIVPLLDFGIAFNDVPYLVMEYASNGTLRERHPAGTQVPLPTVVSYVNQVASALQYAHDLYLIHRDVKPENMLVGANGEILLTDFGIAAVAHNSHTLNDQRVDIGGTVSYMAPEQLEGKPRPASDQYALGVLTYEWLSGKRPFKGTAMEIMVQHMAAPPTSISLTAPMLTPEVERVVFTALAKDPRQRFDSMRAFADALTQASQRQGFPASWQMAATSSPQQEFPASWQTAATSSPRLPAAEAMSATPNFYAPFQASPAFTETMSTTPDFHAPPNSAQTAHTTISSNHREPAIPPRRAPRLGKVILLVTLVLLISAGSVATYVTLHKDNAKPRVVTSSPKPTPTVPDLNKDPAGFYAWATSKPANVQSFADTTPGWGTNDGCTIKGENYELSAPSSPGSIILNTCHAAQTNYVDFIYQVDMTMTRSETAGMLFRSNSVLDAIYLFEVNSDHTYYLNNAKQSFAAQNRLIPQAAFSDQTTNTLAVIARGHDIYLFINRHFLAHTSDATSGSGQIGLFVDALPTDKGGAIADFSNLKIWVL